MSTGIFRILGTLPFNICRWFNFLYDGNTYDPNFFVISCDTDVCKAQYDIDFSTLAAKIDLLSHKQLTLEGKFDGQYSGMEISS